MTLMNTRGFSDAAEYVEKSNRLSRGKLRGSNTFGFGAALDELAQVRTICSKPNWDGYQALPVGEAAIDAACRFLDSLPLDVDVPSIGAEPDGAVTLEWHHSARRTLSISLNSQDELHFAALLGPNRIYGTEAFFGEVPDRILELIQQVNAA